MVKASRAQLCASRASPFILTDVLLIQYTHKAPKQYCPMSFPHQDHSQSAPPVNCCIKNIPRPSPLIPIADLGRGRMVPLEPAPVNWTATLVGVPSCFVGLRRLPVICLARAVSVPPGNPVNWRAMVVTPVCWDKTRSCPEWAAGSGSLGLEEDECVGDACEDRSSWGRSD